LPQKKELDMQEYISKQQQIFRPAAQIFPLVSNFTLLTPAVKDKVEEWQATEDSCSFKVKGFTVGLRIEEKVENKHIKVVGDGGTVPMDFAFWIQLHQVSEGDTRIRLVLHAELNMMMRMMIGKKLQSGLDQAVEGFARAFNQF
jgi:carbon monoxide dehydrogenase subunit G